MVLPLRINGVVFHSSIKQGKLNSVSFCCLVLIHQINPFFIFASYITLFIYFLGVYHSDLCFKILFNACVSGQWSEGLVSAARMVAAATHSLCEAANSLVQGNSSEEKLIAAAKQVKTNPAQQYCTIIQHTKSIIIFFVYPIVQSKRRHIAECCHCT